MRSELRPFDPDRPLLLENCAKRYLPQPGGAWRLVLEAAQDPGTGGIVWVSLAFGVGHLPERSGRWGAYELAYRRLYDRDPPRAR